MRTCAECHAPIASKRADATYCSPSCRSRAHQRRQAVPNTHAGNGPTVQPVHKVHSVQQAPYVPVVHNDRSAEAEQNISPAIAHKVHSMLHEGMSNDLKRYQQEEADLMRSIATLTLQCETIPKQIVSLHAKRAKDERETERLRGLLLLDDPDLYDATLNEKLIDALRKGDPNANRHRIYRPSYCRTRISYNNRELVRSKRMELHSTIEQLEVASRNAIDKAASLAADRDGLTERIRILSDQLRDIRNAKDRLYRTINGTSVSPVATSSARPQQHRQQNGSDGSTAMTAEDLKNTTYETFELPTELGSFLGRLDRNKTAIALTGDSGAGKSHFAFELTRLFSDEGYRTKFFCLEEGFGALTQSKVQKYDISDEVVFVDRATLADVRRDAMLFDVIVIDSFNKLNVNAEEFERLRSDFPRTIFIIIFQKTSSGSIRGGSSILFNSSATIDVIREDDSRIAHMVKGRYGTQGWSYDINRGRCSDSI